MRWTLKANLVKAKTVILVAKLIKKGHEPIFYPLDLKENLVYAKTLILVLKNKKEGHEPIFYELDYESKSCEG